MECLNGRTFSKGHSRFVLINHLIIIMIFLVFHLWINVFIVMVDTWPFSHINSLVDFAWFVTRKKKSLFLVKVAP
jgi:hypothetical protein